MRKEVKKMNKREMINRKKNKGKEKG